MYSTPYITLDHDARELSAAEIDAFASQISGGVLGRGDAEFDAARRVWNGTVDRRPALIARCMNTSDVQATVRFAAAHQMRRQVGRRRQRRPFLH